MRHHWFSCFSSLRLFNFRVILNPHRVRYRRALFFFSCLSAEKSKPFNTTLELGHISGFSSTFYLIKCFRNKENLILYYFTHV